MKHAMKRVAMACLAAAVLAGCSPYTVLVRQAPGMQMPGTYKFRINNKVHDDKGNDITEEVMDKHLPQWYQFMELAGAVRALLEDRGYVCVYDPQESADFLVDMSFTGFYFGPITEQALQTMKLATLLPGGKQDDGTYTHMIVITFAARDSDVKSQKFVTLWEARGIVTDKNEDIYRSGLPMIAVMVDRVPDPEPR